MESRKYQLQKQIIEAIKAKDNDLFSLLKSQWAHRFGVESLEELENLELTAYSQNFTNEDNQKKDHSQDDLLDSDKEISIRDNFSNEKEITNESEQPVNVVELEKKESIEIKSYEIPKKDSFQNESINSGRDHKSTPKIEQLIPLAPRPKYGFLKKWLLKT